MRILTNVSKAELDYLTNQSNIGCYARYEIIRIGMIPHE